MRVCKGTCWTGKENGYKSVKAFEAGLCTSALFSKTKTSRKKISVCESLHPPLIVVVFSNHQSNQDIGDPLVAVTRPCPDGIKSNTSLMPQPLQATCVGVCVRSV